MTNLHTQVLALRDDLNANLLERETAIDAALLALLTKEHCLLLGPPGTAKSLLVRSICERLEGAAYFERLLTKFSTPEELFGPLSLPELEQGRYERVTKGTLVEAHIGFVDEVFKANAAILNSLLTIVNERVFHQGTGLVRVPLLSLFGASNELPEDAGLAALHDRFLLRVTVPYLADDQNLRSLLLGQPTAPSAKLTLDELRAAQVEVERVALADTALDAIVTIRRELAAEGVEVSDRRWKACAKLVRARAWLSGETMATDEHCEVLVHALWSEPSQQRLVERVVSKTVNPLNLEAVELEDAARDLWSQRPDPTDAALTAKLEPLLRQIVDIHTRLETRIANATPTKTARARAALNQVECWHHELASLALRSLSRLHLAPGAA
jgi:MoxR-like ATPase